MNEKLNLFGRSVKVNEFDRKYSLILDNAIRKRRKLMRKNSLKSWMSSFQKLRVLDNIEKSRIKQVLLWYIEHIGERYVPHAYSAESFRYRFFQIEDAMFRDEENERELEPDDFKKTVIKDDKNERIIEIDYSS